MTPTHFGPSGPRPVSQQPAPTPEDVLATDREHLVRVLVTLESLVTELRLRVQWLEADVAAVRKRLEGA